ncbi:MAG: hypothetical protein OXB88_11545 [Bacteriovoracales bacterium]|nr:hypothetical protein [Bacteriovoracales bacterium]
MIQQIIRFLQAYYVVSFSLIIFGIAGIFYYFSASGLYDGNYVSTIYERSSWLEDLEKSKYLDSIEIDIRQGKVRTAYKKFDRFQRKIKEIGQASSLDKNYRILEEDMISLKDSINKLIEFPQIYEVFDVFRGKLVNFRDFANLNDWATLTRTSSRVLAKLKNFEDRTFPEMNTMVRMISQNLIAMERVTNNSILSKNKKSKINRKLKSLSSETLMIKSYMKSTRSSLEIYKKVKFSYGKWEKKIAPEMSLEKMSLDKKSKKIKLFFIVFLLGAITCLMCGVFLFRKKMKDLQGRIEDYVLNVVNNKLLEINPIFENESIEFQREFARGHAYVHKRMSFGSIFQDAFPFGAILLDSNLKVIWSNKKFCHSWGFDFEKIKTEILHWDSVYQLTNLQEIDPVLDALRSTLSGIYQIQVKTIESDRSVPFEMYVNPVDYLGQKRLLIFFYPLSSLEQTIADQARSITAPIKQSLQALIKEDFSGDTLKKLRDEFFSAGIDHLFDLFQALVEVLQSEKKTYEGLVEKSEEKNDFYKNKLISIQDKVSQLRKIQKEYQKELVNLKDGFISLIDGLRTQYLNGENIIENSKGLIKDHIEALEISNDFYDKIQREQKTIDDLEQLRDIFKKVASSVEDSRHKLSQAIDRMSVAERMKEMDRGGRDHQIKKVKIEIKEFDSVFDHFVKSMKALDLILSKISMIIDRDKLNVCEEKLEEMKSKFLSSKKELDALIFNRKKIFLKTSSYEEKLVLDLKNMYKAIVDMGCIQKEFKETFKDGPSLVQGSGASTRL